YAVLSFDFRGFGNSKSVDKSFWNYKQNAWAKRMTAKPTESIDHKNFNPAYFPYLVNDIAAARAFLDERNDAGECNTNSVIVIGAGDGAALGALWMHSEMSRRRQKDPNSLALRPPLAEPEGRDLAAAVWLTIHPKIGSRAISNLLARYLLDVG